MTNLTISLSDETVQRLRRAVRDRYGNRKGALSGLIEESLRERLDLLEMPPSSTQTFKATKGDHILAEAESLNLLAEKLRKKRIDARSTRITSSNKLAPIVRVGLRGRRPS